MSAMPAEKDHPGWGVVPAIVAAVVAFVVSQVGGLAFGWGLLLAIAGAVIAFALGKVAVAVGQRLVSLPARRRAAKVNAVQARLRAFDFRERVTPIVQRLRHEGGHGDHPTDEPRRGWAGFDAEAADADRRVLAPTRELLLELDQPHLVPEVAIQDSDLDPTELSVELDRLLGTVEMWQNGDPDAVPFRF
jgi:hypothetical protein